MNSDANIIPGPAIPECKEWFVMRDLRVVMLNLLRISG